MLDEQATCRLSKEEANAGAFVAYEQLLGETLKPFLAEVYLVNFGIMACYIYGERDANLGDIIDSSAEAMQRPELLRYARRASVDFDGKSQFVITLRMEFVHDALTVLFDIVLSPDYLGVDIVSISFENAVGSLAEGYDRFSAAVADLKRLDS